jgi:hypothetical protein
MRIEGETVGGEGCDSACEFCAPPMRLPRETMRGLIATVAQRVFARKTRDSRLEHLYIEIASAPPEVPVSVYVSLVGLLLQLLVRERRETELDRLAWEYAYDSKYRKVCNQIAAIISRTYVELGDGAPFADDEALLMIRDLLLGIEGTIISRNRFKRITSKDKSGFDFGNNGR